MFTIQIGGYGETNNEAFHDALNEFSQSDFVEGDWKSCAEDDSFREEDGDEA